MWRENVHDIMPSVFQSTTVMASMDLPPVGYRLRMYDLYVSVVKRRIESFACRQRCQYQFRVIHTQTSTIRPPLLLPSHRIQKHKNIDIIYIRKIIHIIHQVIHPQIHSNVYSHPYIYITSKNHNNHDTLINVTIFTIHSIGIVLIFMPESPMFLLLKGRHEETIEILQKIYEQNTSNPRRSYPVSAGFDID